MNPERLAQFVAGAAVAREILPALDFSPDRHVKALVEGLLDDVDELIAAQQEAQVRIAQFEARRGR